MASLQNQLQQLQPQGEAAEAAQEVNGVQEIKVTVTGEGVFGIDLDGLRPGAFEVQHAQEGPLTGPGLAGDEVLHVPAVRPRGMGVVHVEAALLPVLPPTVGRAHFHRDTRQALGQLHRGHEHVGGETGTLRRPRDGYRREWQRAARGRQRGRRAGKCL